MGEKSRHLCQGRGDTVAQNGVRAQVGRGGPPPPSQGQQLEPRARHWARFLYEKVDALEPGMGSWSSSKVQRVPAEGSIEMGVGTREDTG